MCGREILLWGSKLHSTGFVTSIGVQVHKLYTKRQVHHALWEWWLRGPKIPSLAWFLVTNVNNSRSRYGGASLHVVGKFNMKHFSQTIGFWFSITFEVQRDQLSRLYHFVKKNGHLTQHSITSLVYKTFILDILLMRQRQYI